MYDIGFRRCHLVLKQAEVWSIIGLPPYVYIKSYGGNLIFFSFLFIFSHKQRLRRLGFCAPRPLKPTYFIELSATGVYWLLSHPCRTFTKATLIVFRLSCKLIRILGQYLVILSTKYGTETWGHKILKHIYIQTLKQRLKLTSLRQCNQILIEFFFLICKNAKKELTEIGKRQKCRVKEKEIECFREIFRKDLNEWQVAMTVTKSLLNFFNIGTNRD